MGQPGGVVELPVRRAGAPHQVAQRGQKAAVQFLAHHARVGRLAAPPGARGCHDPGHELAGVVQLGHQPPSDLEHRLVVGGVHPQAGAGRPVARGVGVVGLDDLLRGDGVAAALRHLLAVGVQDPSRDQRVVPGDGVEVQVRLGDGIERPGADDVVRLRAYVHGTELAVALRVAHPAAGDLGGQRTGEPGVEHVRLGGEPARLVALLLLIARRHVGERVHRQRGVVGQQRALVVGRAAGVERIPDRERHAEVALPADAPVELQVLGPVDVAAEHVAGMPLDFTPAFDQLIALVGEAHEPLPGGDELQRAVALLVVAHRVLDGPRFAAQRRPVAGRSAVGAAQLLDDGGARLAQVAAGQLGVGTVGGFRVGAVPLAAAECDLPQASVGSHDLAQRQLLFLPPLHVGGVAEGAHHQDTGALFRVGEIGSEDRYPRPVQRRDGAFSEQFAVALVVGMGGDADAGGEQLGTGGGDHDLPVRTFDAERQVVVVAGGGAVLHLGLRYRGAEVHVPHGGCLGAIQMPLAVQVEKAVLRQVAARLADGGVLLVPVHRQADGLPHAHERLLVLGGDQGAQLDEVAP